MNKTMFIDELTINLRELPFLERKQFVDYYDEMIEDYIEDGYNEDEAISMIGNPIDIAKEIIYPSKGRVKNIKIASTGTKVATILLLIIGFPLWGSLLLSVIMLILSVYIVLWCLPFIFGTFALTGFACSIISIIASIFAFSDGIHIGLMQLGVGIILLGCSILSSIVTFVISKFFINLTKLFSKKIVNLFKRKDLIV